MVTTRLRPGMRAFSIAMLAAVLSGSTALADPSNSSKWDYAAPADKLPPVKSAGSNPCAAYGPGFVKVDGTSTCVQVGGSISVGVSGAVGRH